MYIADSNTGDQGAGNDDITYFLRTLMFPISLEKLIIMEYKLKIVVSTNKYTAWWTQLFLKRLIHHAVFLKMFYANSYNSISIGPVADASTIKDSISKSL